MTPRSHGVRKLAGLALFALLFSSDSVNGNVFQQNDIVPVISVPHAKELSQSVGHLEALTANSRSEWIRWCGAILITPRLLLTPSFCALGDNDPFMWGKVEQLRVRFGYLDDDQNRGERYDVKLPPILVDPVNLFALVEIEGTGVSKYRPAKLTKWFGVDAEAGKSGRDSVYKQLSKDKIVIVHHPKGTVTSTQTSESCGALVTRDDSEIRIVRHRCDTMGGSGGGALFRKSDGVLIGMHVRGGARAPGGYNEALFVPDIFSTLQANHKNIFELLRKNRSAGSGKITHLFTELGNAKNYDQTKLAIDKLQRNWLSQRVSIGGTTSDLRTALSNMHKTLQYEKNFSRDISMQLFSGLDLIIQEIQHTKSDTLLSDLRSLKSGMSGMSEKNKKLSKITNLNIDSTIEYLNLWKFYQEKTKEELTIKTTGTGFLINRQHIITNEHSVHDCKKILLSNSQNSRFEVELKDVDEINDIALLSLPKVHQSPFKLSYALGKGRQIHILGFALSGILGDEPSFSTGHISRLFGEKNDTRFLQFSAPVQFGHSGSPVVDTTGAVLGMVQGSVSSLAALARGDVVQNVNIALKSGMLSSFLDSHKIAYEVSSKKPGDSSDNLPDIMENSIFHVQCFGG